MKNLKEAIKSASNMVAIESIILTDVSAKFMQLFADTERKHNSAKESQQDWINAVWAKYGEQSKIERRYLFNEIPERFKVSLKYEVLNDLLNSMNR